MQKRAVKRSIKGAAFSEIFILILATFAFAFVLAEASNVEADTASPKGLLAKILLDVEKEEVTAKPAAPAPKGPPSVTNDPIKTAGLTAVQVPKANSVFTNTGGAITAGKGVIPEGGKVVFDGKNYNILTKEGANAGRLTQEEFTAAKGTGGLSAVTPAAAPAGYTGSITGMTGTMGGIVEGLVWAGIAYMAGQMIGSMLGLQKKQTQALSTALAAGAFTYQFTQGAFGWSAAGAKGAALGGLGGAAALAIGVAAVVFVLMYKKETEKEIKFTCMPYEPPLGGAKCEQCNKDVFRPCSEYRCKALGQACELRNKDTPGKEMCVWVAKGDVTSPKITTWDTALYPMELKYEPDTTRPPALGTKVVRPNAPGKCLQSFTPLSFGITTDEPAQCKIDWNHTAKFEQMRYYFGETNLFMYNHTQTMRLPGPDAFAETSENASAGRVGGAPVFKNDGTTTLFVRCIDANGNENVDEFAFTFCVDKSPDTTPPLVEGTSIPTGSPVQFDVQSVPIDVYVNEPAECKWSIVSKAYDDMENNMTCATEARDINAQLTYTCTGNFTGIKNSEDNKYYIRCKDQPDKEEKDRNVMTQSYELVIRGTQTLNINHVAPNGTVSGSTDAVKVDLEVETEHGSNEGTAFCYFSGTGENASYIPMFETNSFRHKQTLQLASGDYKYYFRCVDLGGNSAEATTSFSVYADKEAPRVSSVYNEEGMGLKVVTNEDAECVYSLTSCSYVFKDAVDAKTVLVYSNANNRKNSYAEWKPNTVYYIKCRDDYGNEPNPNECSVIAMPTPQMKP